MRVVFLAAAALSAVFTTQASADYAWYRCEKIGDPASVVGLKLNVENKTLSVNPFGAGDIWDDYNEVSIDAADIKVSGKNYVIDRKPGFSITTASNINSGRDSAAVWRRPSRGGS
jgi:hypothetical protein